MIDLCKIASFFSTLMSFMLKRVFLSIRRNKNCKGMRNELEIKKKNEKVGKIFLLSVRSKKNETNINN